MSERLSPPLPCLSSLVDSSLLKHTLNRHNVSEGSCRHGGFQCGSILSGQSRVYMRHAAARAADGQSSVCETGVYHGFSAVTWLCAHPSVNLLSFDLQVQPVVSHFLHRLFPKRVTLKEGSSLDALPAYLRSHPEHRCNIISIDGGHFGYLPMHDLFHFSRMAVPNESLVLMDEVGYLNWAGPGWRSGVDYLGRPALAESAGRACCPDATIAWSYARSSELIREIRCVAAGAADISFDVSPDILPDIISPEAVPVAASASSRGWCVGVYERWTKATAARFAALGIPD